MKKISLILMLTVFLTLTGCNGNGNGSNAISNSNVGDNAKIEQVCHEFAEALTDRDYDKKNELTYNRSNAKPILATGRAEFEFDTITISKNGNFADIMAKGDFWYMGGFEWEPIRETNIRFKMQKFDDGWKIDLESFTEYIKF